MGIFSRKLLKEVSLVIREVCSFRLLVLSEKEAMKVGSRNEMSEKLIFHSFNELKDCINEIKISRVHMFFSPQN